MKNLTVNTLKLTSMAFLLSPLLITHSAVAAQRDGVSCPSNTTATYNAGTLRCYERKTYTRDSVCPPLRNLQNVVMQSRGSDRCLPVGVGRPVPSAMTPLPRGNLVGPPDSRYRRIINPAGPDMFRAVVSEFKHPKGAIYTHSPRKGVTCPTGYAADYNSSAKRLKCVKTDRRRAACDWPLFIVHRPGRDLCRAKNIFGTTTGNFTVPKGISGILGNPSRNGWRLIVDHRGNTDYWERTRNVSYRYPVANR